MSAATTKVLTPRADRGCPACHGAGDVNGMPCECRYEEPYSDKWNRDGQAAGWLSRRSTAQTVRVTP